MSKFDTELSPLATGCPAPESGDRSLDQCHLGQGPNRMDRPLWPRRGRTMIMTSIDDPPCREAVHPRSRTRFGEPSWFVLRHDGCDSIH